MNQDNEAIDKPADHQLLKDQSNKALDDQLAHDIVLHNEQSELTMAESETSELGEKRDEIILKAEPQIEIDYDNVSHHESEIQKTYSRNSGQTTEVHMNSTQVPEVPEEQINNSNMTLKVLSLDGKNIEEVSVSGLQKFNVENESGEEHFEYYEDLEYESLANSQNDTTTSTVDGQKCTCPNCDDPVEVVRNDNGVRLHLCEYPNCGKTYTSAYFLKNHIMSHTGEKPFICQFEGCGARFVGRAYLRNHFKVKHKGEGLFPCEICGEQLRNPQQRKSHISQKHPDCEDPVTEGDDSTLNQSQKGQDSESSQSVYLGVSSPFVRQKHTSSKLGTKQFACSTCGFKYTKKFNLERHILRTYECRNAQMIVFIGNNAGENIYQEEMLKMNTLGSILCEWPACFQQFKTSEEMLKHKESHFTDDGKAICVVCEALFNCGHDLVRHVSLNHAVEADRKDKTMAAITEASGPRDKEEKRVRIFKYRCTVCFKKCRTAEQLKAHSQEHEMEALSDSAPYSYYCPVCSKGFNRPMFLDRHMNSVHGTTIQMVGDRLEVLTPPDATHPVRAISPPPSQAKKRATPGPLRTKTKTKRQAQKISIESVSGPRGGSGEPAATHFEFETQDEAAFEDVVDQALPEEVTTIHVPGYFGGGEDQGTSLVINIVPNIMADTESAEQEELESAAEGKIDCRYICLMCSEVFKSSRQLVQHATIHTTNDNLDFDIPELDEVQNSVKMECSICSKAFASSQQLEQHIAAAHVLQVEPLKAVEAVGQADRLQQEPDSNERIHLQLCEDSKQTVTQAALLDNEAKKRRQVLSNIQGDANAALNTSSLAYDPGYPEDVQVPKTKAQGERFQCDVCRASFRYRVLLVKHLQQGQCSQGADAAREDSGDEEEADGGGVEVEDEDDESDDQNGPQSRKFKPQPRYIKTRVKMTRLCQICNSTFTRRNEYENHLDTHGIRCYQCHYCDMKFRYAHQVKPHEDAVHPDKERLAKNRESIVIRNIDDDIVDVVQRRGVQELDSIGYTSPNSSLNGHMYRLYDCQVCTEKFTNKKMYLQHLLSHGIRAHECQSCGTKFIHEHHLKRHLPGCIERGGEAFKPFKNVNVKGRVFVNRKRKGKKRTLSNGEDDGSDEKEIECNICKESYTHSVLQTHIMESHDMEWSEYQELYSVNSGKRRRGRPRKLTINTSFLESAAKGEKNKSRSGKRFVCPECGRKFKLRQQIKQHMKHHYGSSDSEHKQEEGEAGQPGPRAEATELDSSFQEDPELRELWLNLTEVDT